MKIHAVALHKWQRVMMGFS